MKIALFTDLFKGLTLEESIPMIAEAGYNYIEINSIPYWSPQLDLSIFDYQRLDNIKNSLSKHNISVAAISSCTDIASLNNEEREKAVAYSKNAILASEHLDCHLTTSMFSGNSIMSFKAQNEVFNASIAELSDFSQQHNTRLALEIYPGCYINSTQGAIEFLSANPHDNVGYLFCLPHVASQNEDFFESIDLAKDRIFHFHFADTNIGESEHHHLTLGKGSIDFDALIKKIVEIGYDDSITIQVYSEKGNLVQIAAENRLYLEGLIKKNTA